jgi:hypothetical protein
MGAGYIDTAIVTAATDSGARQMVLAPADDRARADPSGWKVRGRRATLSGTYRLDGLPADTSVQLGAPGDYEREPRFSGGAWRFAAVQLGGLERLLALLREHLTTTAMKDDPVHRARFGAALAGVRSAYL